MEQRIQQEQLHLNSEPAMNLDFSHQNYSHITTPQISIYMPRWISRAKIQNFTFLHNTNLEKVANTVRSRNGTLKGSRFKHDSP